MGASSSKYKDHWDANKDVFEDEIDFQKYEVNRLHDKFLSCDVRDTSLIFPDEFFAYFKLEPEDTLNKKIFYSMDVRGDGRLDFCQFVCTFWNFLSLPANQLGAYAHFLFDDGRNGGRLGPDQVKDLIEVVYQQKCEGKNNASRFYEKFRKEKFEFSAANFNDWTKGNSSFMANVIGLHQKLQLQVLGKEYWNILTKKRAEKKKLMHPLYIYKVLLKRYEDKPIETSNSKSDTLPPESNESNEIKETKGTDDTNEEISNPVSEDESKSDHGPSNTEHDRSKLDSNIDHDSRKTENNVSGINGGEVLATQNRMNPLNWLKKILNKIESKSQRNSKETSASSAEKSSRSISDHATESNREQMLEESDHNEDSLKHSPEDLDDEENSLKRGVITLPSLENADDKPKKKKKKKKKHGKNAKIHDVVDEEAIAAAEKLKRKREKRDKKRREQRDLEEKERERKSRKPIVTSVYFARPLAQRLTSSMSDIEKRHMMKKLRDQQEAAEIEAGVRKPKFAELPEKSVVIDEEESPENQTENHTVDEDEKVEVEQPT